MYKDKQVRINGIERAIRILRYLKWHTNKDNKLTQNELRDVYELMDTLGHKKTFNTTIKMLDRSLNTNADGYHYPDEADWRIIVDGLRPENESDLIRLGGMYYNHPFSYEDINLILEGIWSLRTISTDKAKELTDKLKRELTDKFYDKQNKVPYANIFKMQEINMIKQESLQNNLKLIQAAIIEEKQLKFTFNSWFSTGNPRKIEPTPAKKNPHVLSPYYIVVNNERYYLLANTEPYEDGDEMSIWRIDLMSDIELQTEKITPKEKVQNVPIRWNDTGDFHTEHLNMAYDTPRLIKMKISNASGEKEAINYNFLYDWFGKDNFNYIGEDEEGYYGHIITARVSPFAIKNWALQYSTRVEILEPSEVREGMQEKINELNDKYSIK